MSHDTCKTKATSLGIVEQVDGDDGRPLRVPVTYCIASHVTSSHTGRDWSRRVATVIKGAHEGAGGSGGLRMCVGMLYGCCTGAVRVLYGRRVGVGSQPKYCAKIRKLSTCADPPQISRNFGGFADPPPISENISRNSGLAQVVPSPLRCGCPERQNLRARTRTRVVELNRSNAS